MRESLHDVRIRHRCSCGAEFEGEGPYTTVVALAKDWDAKHDDHSELALAAMAQQAVS